MYSTLREAVEAHDGEAKVTMQAYFALSRAEQDAIIEFLKTLQVLSPSAKAAIVDETGKPRTWRDFPYDLSRLLQ